MESPKIVNLNKYEKLKVRPDGAVTWYDRYGGSVFYSSEEKFWEHRTSIEIRYAIHSMKTVFALCNELGTFGVERSKEFIEETAENLRIPLGHMIDEVSRFDEKFASLLRSKVYEC